jgi:hypothetical protein
MPWRGPRPARDGDGLVGAGLVEEEGFDRVLDVGAEFSPRVGMREDALADGLGSVAAALFLGYLEDDLAHRGTLQRSLVNPTRPR